MAPAVEVAQSLTTLGSTAQTDPAAAVKKVVTLFAALGASLTKTGTALHKLPPPAFAGGDAFAAQVVKAFGAAGPAITAEAKKLASDPSSLADGMGGLSGSLTKAVAPLKDLQGLKIAPATQEAILALPACAKLKSLATG
jgi:hypothetical protein